MERPSRLQILQAAFLVAGTCIGGGMLALPIATAESGFIPSICIMLLAWLAMTATALLITEAGFWMKKDDAHIISMSKKLLGNNGKRLSWLLYLFICYASLIAYTAGAGHILQEILQKFEIPLSKGLSCIVFTGVFGSLLWTNHRVLGMCNFWLFIAMIVSYALLITHTHHHIEYDLLLRQNWHLSWMALPLLLTAFSFQTMVPSLHPYLNHDLKALRTAIILGTTIALFIYILWQINILGTIPYDGEHGLREAFIQGLPATSLLGTKGNTVIHIIASSFAFLAIVTSFIGIALGLYDFLSDGLDINKKGKGHLQLVTLVLLPTVFFAIWFERIFLIALDTSGGFGDTILNGLMPICMVIMGRYIMKLPGHDQRKYIGKKILFVLFLFYFFVFTAEIFLRTEFASPKHDTMELIFSEEQQEVLNTTG